MATSGTKAKGQKPGRKHPPAPRDVLDFHLRWSEFRTLACSLAERPELTEPERAVVRWLTELADRVGPRDLG
ncbi:hypothetical protein ACQKLX_03845 [Bosea sp. NPDC003192]|uniref:hypothetical protein n=1 Tax=Bosea sp. NPDC003192 TaxID=3390551 RepID=UPI003D04918B